MGIGCRFKNSQITWTRPSPNTEYIVPQRLVYTTTNVTTGGINDSLDDIIITKPVPRPNTTNMLIILLVFKTNPSLLQPPENTTTVPLNQFPIQMFLTRLCWDYQTKFKKTPQLI